MVLEQHLSTTGQLLLFIALVIVVVFIRTIKYVSE